MNKDNYKVNYFYFYVLRKSILKVIIDQYIGKCYKLDILEIGCCFVGNLNFILNVEI